MQPADICNRALDAIGVTSTIGDMQEGTREAQVLLRHYGACLRQISRSAHWNSLRKKQQLVLLNDATGQTTAAQTAAGGPVTVGTGTVGMQPWLYEYRWPVDCVKARFVPLNRFGQGVGTPTGNYAIPSTPLFGGMSGSISPREMPTRFLVANDTVPIFTGAATTWGDIPDTSQTLGQGLVSQTVILTNQPNSALVYTALITYPDQWDPLFQQAFVSLLACMVVIPLVADRKLAMALRNEQIAIAKRALDEARVRDGDEGWTTVDHQPDWLRQRYSGYGGRGYGDAGGMLGYGWDACSFGDGTAY
jgi:hypothetical protein